MSDSQITASFEVLAGTAQDFDLDITGMSPDEIAAWLNEHADGISLCHQCSRDVSDPELGDLTGFSVDGVSFERNGMTGHWEAYR